MLQRTKPTGGSKLGGGLVTLPNFFNLDGSQSPNSMDVKFDLGGSVQKRYGVTTINAAGANTLASTAGWAMFDFGAAGDLRWLVASAGTSVYVSSNRGVSWVIAATDRSQTYQSFERSKPYLIACSDTFDAILYWAGSVSTFMLALAPGSAPGAKYAIDFQGFLMLMNTASRKRGIYYSDNNVITTDPWDSAFDLPSSFDDEITGPIILNKKLYVFTKYKVFRITFIGGNPDFAYQDVKAWGAVPRTIKKVTLPNVGEVIIALGWDKKLRIFDGSEDQIISDTIERSNGMSPFSMDQITTTAIDRSFAEVDNNEQVYKLWVAMSGSSYPTHMLAYNYRLEGGAFYTYQNQPYLSAIMAESSGTKTQALVAMRSTGFIYKMDTLTTDAGVAIDEYYESPFFFGKTPQVATKDQRISLYFSVDSFGTLYYLDRANFTNTFGLARQPITFADTTNRLQLVKTIDVPRTQNVYQFRLTSSAGTAAPWRLNRYDFEQSDLGVGKA